jgi:hypothetical protein
MHRLILLLIISFTVQSIQGQDYTEMIGSSFSTVNKTLKQNREGKIEVNNTQVVDGQQVRSLKLIIGDEESYASEVTFLFISDICIHQLYKLHFEKARDLISKLDKALKKNPIEDYVWSEPKKYVDIMYQVKKIPPDHVLAVWLDVRNSLIN